MPPNTFVRRMSRMSSPPVAWAKFSTLSFWCSGSCSTPRSRRRRISDGLDSSLYSFCVMTAGKSTSTVSHFLILRVATVPLPRPGRRMTRYGGERAPPLCCRNGPLGRPRRKGETAASSSELTISAAISGDVSTLMPRPKRNEASEKMQNCGSSVRSSTGLIQCGRCVHGLQSVADSSIGRGQVSISRGKTDPWPPHLQEPWKSGRGSAWREGPTKRKRIVETAVPHAGCVHHTILNLQYFRSLGSSTYSLCKSKKKKKERPIVKMASERRLAGGPL